MCSSLCNASSTKVVGLFHLIPRSKLFANHHPLYVWHSSCMCQHRAIILTGTGPVVSARNNCDGWCKVTVVVIVENTQAPGYTFTRYPRCGSCTPQAITAPVIARVRCPVICVWDRQGGQCAAGPIDDCAIALHFFLHILSSILT